METLQRDFLAIAHGIGADHAKLADNLRVRWAYAVSGAGFTAYAGGLLARERPDLLVVDNYQSFSGASDMSDPVAWETWFRPLDRAVKEHGVALLLVDHTPKPANRDEWTARQSVYMAAGTSRKANAARASAELTEAGKDDPRFRLRFGKNADRNGLTDGQGRIVRDLYIEHSDSASRPFWRTSQDQTQPSRSQYEAEVRRILKAAPQATVREVAEKAGCGKSQAAEIVGRLRRAGL